MIRLAYKTEFKIAKDAQTANVVRSAHGALLRAGLEPLVPLTLLDGAGYKRSAAERLVRRFPELKAFDHTRRVPWEPQRIERLIGNDFGSPAFGVAVDFSLLTLEIAAGIPKRYPFFKATIRVTDPDFGSESGELARSVWPGLTIENHHEAESSDPGGRGSSKHCSACHTGVGGRGVAIMREAHAIAARCRPRPDREGDEAGGVRPQRRVHQPGRDRRACPDAARLSATR